MQQHTSTEIATIDKKDIVIIKKNDIITNDIEVAYLDVGEILLYKLDSQGIRFYYFCGGRGIGKTFSALILCYKVATSQIKFDNKIKRERFIYLRRTMIESSLVSSEELNIFKEFNRKFKTKVQSAFSQQHGYGVFYHKLNDGNDDILGYSLSLSTFKNLRGVDLNDVTVIIYDECIPQDGKSSQLKREGFLLLHMLETINRNRKIEGRQEILLIMLSNPIDLSSTLLSNLRITPILNNMIFNNQGRYTDVKRHLYIEKIKDHDISKAKMNSDLYDFAVGTGFVEEALSGDFVNDNFDRIEKIRNLNEYTPYVSIEQVTIYQHKSKQHFYISKIYHKCRYTFKAHEQEKIRKYFYWQYKLMLQRDCVTYDSYDTKVILHAMIRYKDLKY